MTSAVPTKNLPQRGRINVMSVGRASFRVHTSYSIDESTLGRNHSGVRYVGKATINVSTSLSIIEFTRAKNPTPVIYVGRPSE